MTTIDMPAAPGFRAVRFGLRANTQRFTSPLNRAVQTLDLPGALWFATFELPPMTRAEAAAWQAFLVDLSGSAGRFFAFDPDGHAPRGAYVAGTPPVGDDPRVAGPAQAGSTLATDGWRANVAGLLLPGDYLEIGGELKMATKPVDSDATGAATVAFRPALRASPTDGSTLMLIGPRTTMMLADDEQAVWDGDLNAVVRGLSFSAVEVF
ncbi:MAG: hypothetical protein ACE5H8_02170 [Alphaproteobacteria bacterium]